jgi:hypothetical protein
MNNKGEMTQQEIKALKKKIAIRLFNNIFCIQAKQLRIAYC